MSLTVNGQEVDQSLVEQEAQRIRPEYERAFADMPEDKREAQLKEWSQENVIERILLEQKATEQVELSDEEIEQAYGQWREEFEKKGGKLDEIEDDQLKEVKEQLKKQLQVQRFLEQLYEDIEEPSEQEIKNYYEENKEKYRTPERVRAAHIVKHPNWQMNEQQALEQMQEIKQRLDAGEMFEPLAGEVSDCPDNYGDLGYFTRGQMVEEFEDVVFNMSPGSVSDVFHTRYGYHIAKVHDRREARIPELKDMRDRVVKELTEEKRREAVEKYIDKLKQQAEINTD